MSTLIQTNPFEKYKSIVGLDLSFTKTGLYSIRPSEEKGSLITTIKHLNSEVRRMDSIWDQINQELDLASKTFIVIENFSFASGNKSHQIGGLGYFIRWQLWQNLYPYIEVAPSQLKMFCTGKGNAKKDLILKDVFKRFDFDTDDDNIADAFVLAQIGRGLTGKFKPTADFQRKVLSDLHKRYDDALAQGYPVLASA